MKKVIFVGGTSYSGSTLLDMILANEDKGYSLGEIVALFRPTMQHHLKKIKTLKENPNWEQIIEKGENSFYSNLFDTFPDIDYFVDSSKNPFWIAKQMKLLQKDRIPYQNVLIYKSGPELALSYDKRNKLEGMGYFVRVYYKLYFYFINNFKSISYYQLIKNDQSLKNLCEYLNIEYFDGKKKYWEKKHKTVFGNLRALAHTDNLRPENYKGIQKLTKEGRKKLYYITPENDNIIKEGERIEKKYRKIFDIIKNNNIDNKTSNNYDINTSQIWIVKIFLKYFIKNRVNHFLVKLKN